MLITGAAPSEASPAEPVDAPSLTLLVEEAQRVRVPSPVEGEKPQEVLRVEGLLLEEDSKRFPGSAVFSDDRAAVQLCAHEADRVGAGDIIVLEHVGHSVYTHQPTHLIVDVITREDRENEGLMRIAEHNPGVPVTSLKRAEELLRDADAPYMQNGFDGLMDWDLLVVFTPAGPSDASAADRYSLHFYAPGGSVSAEWYIEVDLARSAVTPATVFQSQPAP
jgi:hypothetical protein